MDKYEYRDLGFRKTLEMDCSGARRELVHWPVIFPQRTKFLWLAGKTVQILADNGGEANRSRFLAFKAG